MQIYTVYLPKHLYINILIVVGMVETSRSNDSSYNNKSTSHESTQYQPPNMSVKN
jgi:hypothetical protein